MKKGLFTMISFCLVLVCLAAMFSGCGFGDMALPSYEEEIEGILNSFAPDITVAEGETTTKIIETEADIKTEIITEAYTETEPQTETEEVTETEAVEEELPIFDLNKAYYDKIIEYQNFYGIPVNPSSAGLDYEAGLYYANLVDFNLDNVNELVLGYITDANEMLYEIWASTGADIYIADSGNMLQVGGVCPYISIAYTRDGAYMETGSRQSFTNIEYRAFTGASFYPKYTFKCTSGSGGMVENCEVNGASVTSEEYEEAWEGFNGSMYEYDVYELFYQYKNGENRVEKTIQTLGY